VRIFSQYHTENSEFDEAVNGFYLPGTWKGSKARAISQNLARELTLFTAALKYYVVARWEHLSSYFC